MVRTTPAKVLLTTTLQPFVVQLSGSLIARQGSAARHPDPGMPAGPSSRVRRPAGRASRWRTGEAGGGPGRGVIASGGLGGSGGWARMKSGFVFPRARGLDQDSDPGRGAACACRAPPHPAVSTRWGVGRVELDEAKPTQSRGGQACGGVPALKRQCGRAQRIPLAEEPPASRTRSPQKARVPDSRSQLFPHVS